MSRKEGSWRRDDWYGITVQPTGRFGMMGGGKPLAQNDVGKLSDILV